MTSAYCTAADLYDYGLPRGVIPNPAQIVSIVDATSNELELGGHGFALDDTIVFKSEAGGTPPGGLTAGTTYYAKPTTDDRFQVALTPGGAAIDISAASGSFSVYAPLPIEKAIERASALVDDMIIAHGVPMTAPYPVTVVAVTADLAAWYLLNGTGGMTTGLAAKITEAQKILERWAKGVPVRGATVPVATNLAVSGGRSPAAPRKWEPCGGGIP